MVGYNRKVHTTKDKSQITDNLRCLLVVSRQTHLFFDIFESYDYHRQISFKIKIKSHIQQKSWENFVSMKQVCQKNKKRLWFDRGCLFFNEFSVWSK